MKQIPLLLKNRGIRYCLIGFISIVLASTFLPLYTPKICASYFCPVGFQSSAVVDALGVLQWPNIYIPGVLGVVLPLLMPIFLLFMGISYFIRPCDAFLQWFFGGWVIGFISFMVFFLYSIVLYYPFWGFFGIVIGYIFFFAGFNSFLSKKG